VDLRNTRDRSMDIHGGFISFLLKVDIQSVVLVGVGSDLGTIERHDVVGNGFHGFQGKVVIINVQVAMSKRKVLPSIYISLSLSIIYINVTQSLPVEPVDFILDKFLGEETELFQISADLEHLFILFFINIGLVAIFTSNSVIFNSIRVHCGGVCGKVRKKVFTMRRRGGKRNKSFAEE
jgi:hypothetical protein